jgi:integrase
MPRKPSNPTYRLHRQSGQAVVTLPDVATGRRRDFLLGLYLSPESKTEYKRLVLEWETNGRRLPTEDAAADVTVAELIARFWEHVESYYRHPDGTPTGEVQAFTYSLRPLNYLHGGTHAKEFGPLALKAVRELLVKGYEHPEYGPQPDNCRTLVNARVKRIRQMFRWAVSNQLVPASVLQGLQAVEALKRGRSAARESKPVRPVARAVVEDTLNLLQPMMADMVRVQLETGMRPGELVAMRICDIDMTGALWLYRPGSDQGPLGSHKTAHHGHQRVVVLGPKAQRIVRQYLTTELQGYLWSPRKLVEEKAAIARANRKSKVQPSQMDRKKARPKKVPGDRYTTLTYGRAIANAIKRHNRKAKETERIPHWHPHQLRHTRALELKREFGLDTARAILGHRSPCITEMYAGADLIKAQEAMAKLG